MNRRDALPYIAFDLDSALAVRSALDRPAGNARLVGWQCGYEPLFVAVWSYLSNDIRLSDEEAEEIATDYLAEIAWFGPAGPRPADYVL